MILIELLVIRTLKLSTFNNISLKNIFILLLHIIISLRIQADSLEITIVYHNHIVFVVIATEIQNGSLIWKIIFKNDCLIVVVVIYIRITLTLWDNSAAFQLT